MIQKPFDSIDKADVDSLVASKAREGRSIDYKEQMPGGKDADKKEFLADVSSFANAAGGDMLFGVAEERDGDNKATGIPAGVPGLPGINLDAEIRRLENMIRDGIKPRIPGVRLRPVEGFDGGPGLLLRVPKSFAAPHMVTYQDHSRFYSRNSAGKYPLDVGEIRTAFAFSESLPARVRAFREERLGRIVAGETPAPMREGPKVVLHVLPLQSLEPAAQIDIQAVDRQAEGFGPMFSMSGNRRYNLDGLLFHSTQGTPAACLSYMQLFRNGAVEAVDGRMIAGGAGGKVFPAQAIESGMVTALAGCLGGLQRFSAAAPVFIMIAMLGVQGCYIRRDGDTEAAFDRDDLLLPDLLAEELPVDVPALFRPAFDAMWQASGWSRSFSYGPDGAWTGHG